MPWPSGAATPAPHRALQEVPSLPLKRFPPCPSCPPSAAPSLSRWLPQHKGGPGAPTTSHPPQSYSPSSLLPHALQPKVQQSHQNKALRHPLCSVIKYRRNCPHLGAKGKGAGPGPRPTCGCSHCKSHPHFNLIYKTHWENPGSSFFFFSFQFLRWKTVL